MTTGKHDVPLKDDIRQLGRLLGETLREQGGDELFWTVESIRQLAKEARAGRPGRSNPAGRVLNNHALPRINCETLRGRQEQVRERFLTHDLAARHASVERFRGQPKLPQVSFELDPVGAGRDRDFQPAPPAFPDEFANTRVGPEPAADDFKVD